MTLRDLYSISLGGVHKNIKLSYYLHGIGLMLMPQWLCRRKAERLRKKFKRLPASAQEDILFRVNYYCHLLVPQSLPADTPMLEDNTFRHNDRPWASALARRKRRLAGPLPFFFDTYEYTRCYSQQLHWCVEGGDVNTEMQLPTITKSRLIPSPGQASNNVLLKLNKVRHFFFLNDPYSWEEKQSRVIFRGVVKDKPRRQQFLDMWQGHKLCDISDKCDKSIIDHLHYRYIMALEGNDVASNLKWVMSSNSIAVMPRPTCETWFMEGRLRPGYHYIEISPDYHDLAEKIEYYETHPEEAKAIVRHAHEWVNQFRDAEREDMISILVMDKYFSMTGQRR